jgi:predicted class III extradiol MEMO1 family dioxygenase
MSNGQIIREASHAGSWYSDSKSQLNSQLDGWLSAVDPPVSCIGPLSNGEQEQQMPVPGARMIIAPYVNSVGKQSDPHC